MARDLPGPGWSCPPLPGTGVLWVGSGGWQQGWQARCLPPGASSVPDQGPGAIWLLRARKQHQVDGVAWGSMLLDVEEKSPALAGLAMAAERLVKTTHLEQESTSSLWSLTSA